MVRLTVKQWGAVVATAIVAAATGVSAGFIWDSQLGGSTNENLWGGYAYYYIEGYYNTDPDKGGHLPCFETKSCRTENPGKETVTSAKETADADGEWPYVGGAGGEDKNALYLFFKGLGPESGSPDYYINPEVGVGLLLSAKAGGSNPVGIGEGFDKVTAVKFRMKTSKSINNIRFKIESLATSGVGKENAYGKVLKGTNDEWVDFNINIGTGAERGCADNTTWLTSGTNAGEFPDDCKVGELTLAKYFGAGYKFKMKDATKIAWHIATAGIQENPALTDGSEGMVWIDKIEIVGYDYTASTVCKECVGTTMTPPAGAWKLSDFEGEEPVQNSRGKYWFYYDDHETDGTSQVVDGIVENEYSETGYSLDVAGNGNGGDGVLIGFTLGSTMTSASGDPIKPFVGLGTELFVEDENDNQVLYNAGSGADNGIYFQYKTSFDEKNFLEVEVHDKYALDNPDGGEVYFVQLPGTGGVWKSATVKFSRLELPSWAPKDRKGSNEAFDPTRIGKLQFKVSGSPTNGTFNVDNVYVMGAAPGDLPPPPPIGVKLVNAKAKALGLRATYSRGVVGVNWNTAASVASGKVTLVNTKGRVVASAPIAKAGKTITARLGAGTIPTGMYFVRVNAKDAGGKRIVQQAPISIVK